MYMYMICPYLQHSVISGFIDGLTRPGTGSGMNKTQHIL